MVVLSADGVGLPSATPFFAGNAGGTLSKRAALWQVSAPVIAARAFAALFLRAQVAVERSARALVSGAVLIAALVAHRRLPCECAATTQLGGTPLLAEPGGVRLPALRLKARPGAQTKAGIGQLLGLVGAIAARPKMAVAVARQTGALWTPLSEAL